MNTSILGGNQIREKTTAAFVSVFNIYYKENFLQLCTDADSYQHAGTHLQKAATFSCSPATTGRELQPPDLVYQPLLEGRYYRLPSFTSLSWKGATTPYSRLPASPGRELLPPDLVYQLPLEGSYNPLTEGFDLQHHHGPCFIKFSYWIQQLPHNTTCRPLFIIFSNWTHYTLLSSNIIKLKLITPSIHSLNHQPINQQLIFNHNQLAA